MSNTPFQSDLSNDTDFLRGKLLIAMPNMGDPRFERSVICICEHSPEGAMGLIINLTADNVSFPELVDQLGIETPGECEDLPVFTGGPVEPNRGFVLHSADYVQDTTLVVSELFALSATLDVLKALASGQGPQNSLVALGYAGWGAGQLESEIQANAWLHTEVDTDLLFMTEPALKWPLAMAKLGVDVSQLSSSAGHA
ncbi:MAG: YqgE/AlgH family protein [Alphaproteobacteria bacterium]